MKTISVESLCEMGACEKGIDGFVDLFQVDCVEFTRENWARAIYGSSNDDVIWFMQKCFTHIPREWFLDFPLTAYFLAYHREGSRADTRTKACEDPMWALEYANRIDNAQCEETWAAMQGSEFYKIQYKKWVGPSATRFKGFWD